MITRTLLIAACLAALPARASDPEVDTIRLYSSRRYDPNQEHGRSFKSFFLGIGAAMMGPGKDLGKEIRTKLEGEDLRAYFPDARERSRLAERIADEMRSRYLDQGYSNRTVVLAYRHATNELVRAAVKRVLEKEGLRDVNRAELWAAKILAPYNACVSQARNHQEAGKCGEGLEADLVKNLGLAMSYELPRQEFGAAYARGRPQEFQACLSRVRLANARVKECTFEAVKSGAKAFSRAKVIAAAKKALGAEKAEKLADRVLPEFHRCLDTARDRDGFVKCGNTLLGRAGAELSAEGIRNDARVKAAVVNAGEIERLAAAGREAFGRCFAENERKNLRDPAGTLRTDNCENFVKMETIREVATSMILGRIDQNMPGAPAADVDRIRTEVKASLWACWNSQKTERENAACLRTAAMKLATLVAGERMKREIPKSIVDKDPGLRERAVQAFAGCLEKKLPANLFSATNIDTYTDQCASEVFKTTALAVAEAKVREALGQVANQMPDETVMNGLVDNFVKKAFSECLGANPDSKKLEECSLRLQKNIASTLAQALLPFKVDEFFRQGGGLEAYGLDVQKKKELLDGVIKGHKECLRTKVKSSHSEASSDEVNDCFKATIKDLALLLGPLEFERMAKANGASVNDPTFAGLRGNFKADLGACMDEKRAREHSVQDYLAGLETCQARLSKEYTVKVAKNELSKTITELVADASAGGERERIERELFAAFDACMEKAAESTGREACVKKLRDDATLSIARSSIRGRTLKELETTELPESLRAFERKLEDCLAKENANKNDCTRAYVKESVVTLGKLVLQKKMAAELKDQFEAVKPKLKPLEIKFETCVNSVEGPLDAAFLQKIDGCAQKLSSDAVELALELVLGGSDNAPEPASASTSIDTSTTAAPGTTEPVAKVDVSDLQLSDMIARTFLCLNGQLGRETETSLQNVDPESMEAELLKLIGAYVAHDLGQARGQYEAVLEQVKTELNAAGPEASRQRLVDHLVKGGMADTLLRAMLKSELEKAMIALPAEKQPPAALKAALLDPARLEKALPVASLEKLRPLMADRVLEPVLASGTSLRSSAVLKALREARKTAAAEALASPEFKEWENDPALRHLRDALK